MYVVPLLFNNVYVHFMISCNLFIYKHPLQAHFCVESVLRKRARFQS
jgi:hypothetical protein